MAVASECEFGFVRRKRARKAREKQAMLRLLKWGMSAILTVGVIAVFGLTWYDYSHGDNKGLLDAFLASLNHFGEVFVSFGNAFRETWPGLVFMLFFTGAITGLVAFLSRDRGEQRALTPIYWGMARVQRGIESGSQEKGKGFQVALYTLSDALALNPELLSKCRRFFDDLADDLSAQEARGELSTEHCQSLRCLLDEMANALVAAGERRDQLLSAARFRTAKLTLR